MNKKPDRKFCGAQVQRFMCFEPSFPKNAAGVRVLIETLQSAARYEDHAAQIVEHLLDYSNACPTPSAIREAAGRFCGDSDLPRGCERCYGGYYVSVEINGRSCAQRCSCPRGQRLHSMDLERRAKGVA